VPHSDDAGLTRRQIVQVGGAAMAAGALMATGGAAAATTGRGVVDVTQPPEAFPHVWELAVGGDWARQALRRDYQDQLLEARRDLGFEALRFHGILSTEMSVYAPTAGVLPRPAAFTRDPYSFFNVDQVYDFLVEHGMHPFVELSDMPEALAANRPRIQTFLYGFNSAVPSDSAEWGRLVGAFAEHLVDRYGIQRVQRLVRAHYDRRGQEAVLPAAGDPARRRHAAAGADRHRRAAERRRDRREGRSSRRPGRPPLQPPRP
jgi:hypothetical protein